MARITIASKSSHLPFSGELIDPDFRHIRCERKAIFALAYQHRDHHTESGMKWQRGICALDPSTRHCCAHGFAFVPPSRNTDRLERYHPRDAWERTIAGPCAQFCQSWVTALQSLSPLREALTALGKLQRHAQCRIDTPAASDDARVERLVARAHLPRPCPNVCALPECMMVIVPSRALISVCRVAHRTFPGR